MNFLKNVFNKSSSFWYYVLLKGVFLWGGGMFVALILAQYFFSFPNEGVVVNMDWVKKNGFLWAIIGFFWGIYSFEKKR